MSKKKRKILARLDALERLARRAMKNDRRGHGGRGPHRDHDRDDDCGEPGGGCGFDEKRVIDTVTRLVTERVGRVIQKEAQKRDGGRDSHDGRRDDRRDGGGHRDHWDDRGGRDERRDGGGRDHDRRDGERRGDGRDRDGGGERRMVDLLVGLISEHVQEIVATELDLRLSLPHDDADEGPEESRKPPRKQKPAESE